MTFCNAYLIFMDGVSGVIYVIVSKSAVGKASGQRTRLHGQLRFLFCDINFKREKKQEAAWAGTILQLLKEM